MKFPTYKGRPLVRSGDKIYYGSMKGAYVAMLDIKSKKEVNGLEVADRVHVQLLATDPATPPAKMIAKRADKEGLWAAIEIADIWLEKVEKESKPEEAKAE
ncbi:MAG: hypothetical protein Q4C42_07040 [Clostridia bacterium]|nr:hypothetical protein [Clostridia bacterium]